MNRDISVSDSATTLVEHVNTLGPSTPAGPSDILSAKSYGAVGDGVTDDTDALEDLFTDAFEMGKAVYFDPGVYLIRRSLPLRSHMEIFGKDATLKKQSAVTTTLAENAVKGNSYIEVTSTSGFKVGDQFFIAESNGGSGSLFPAANWCTNGIITNIEGNRIYFNNCLSPRNEGCIYPHVAGRKVCTSFALLRSWGPLYDCDGVYIHNLTLDGNQNGSEAREWSNGCIHIDSDKGAPYTGSHGITFDHVQRNLIARDLVIVNSPYDGISDQGRGGAVIDNCKIANCFAHGVHFGTQYTNAKVINCDIDTCGLAGVFCCQSVENIVVSNNYIKSCKKGVSETEYASPAKNVVITGNIFDTITDVVFDFSLTNTGYGNINISNNIIKNVKATVLKLASKSFVVFTGNVITNFSTAPTYVITMASVSNGIISNNVCPSNTNYIQSSSVTNVVIANNSWDTISQ